MDELQSWLILSRAHGFHAGLVNALLPRFGAVEAIVAASRKALMEQGVGARAASAIVAPNLKAIAHDRDWLDAKGRSYVSCRSPAYPVLLAEIYDAPVGLFVRGDVSSLSRPQLAIVGSRTATASGRETALSFAAQLSQRGVVVTSGLAAGIDAASHRGALNAGGKTIAVCATGLDSVYPRAHTALAESIEAAGALVSELPPKTEARKILFPRRNRIISALSLGTLVVEAAERSGSLITARCAADQGREVFAIPGSIRNPLSRGCHQLIRQGAKLVESAEDILAELGPLAAFSQCQIAMPLAANKHEESPGALDKEYKILLDALGFDPVGIDQLVERSGFKPEAVASMLLILELEGRIESMSGALYARI